MKVPYRLFAYVPQEKMANYLLSLTHQIGKNKARVFRSRGFNETNMDVLESELLKIVHTNNFSQKTANQYGIRYTVIGIIQGPNGKTVNIKTGWMIYTGKRAPRFVTAYPV